MNTGPDYLLVGLRDRRSLTVTPFWREQPSKLRGLHLHRRRYRHRKVEKGFLFEDLLLVMGGAG